jgi:hypothetical protein
MSGEKAFDKLDEYKHGGSGAASPGAIATADKDAAAGSVKKAAPKDDGKSSIPGAVFNLANAVSV